MPVKESANRWLSHVYLGLLLIVILSLPFSRGLLSFSVILMSLCSIVWLILNNQLKTQMIRGFIWLPILFFCVALLDYLRAEDVGIWIGKTELMLFWMATAIGFAPVTAIINRIQTAWVVVILMAVVVEISLISLVHYYLHLEEINAALLQSKHIPIVGNMHHIYFGILTALLIIYALTERMEHRPGPSLSPNLKMTFLFLLFISIHILSSRTGLFSLYLTLFCGCLFMVIKHMVSLRKLIIAILLMILIPATAYFVVPSFKNKITNTIEDLGATSKGGEEVNFKSMGMRIEAWKMGLELIKRNPVLGVGTGNVDIYFANQFDASGTMLLEENRVGPHNEFLTLAVRHGLWAPMLLLGLFLVIGLRSWRENTLSLFAVVVLLFISANLESIMDRQHGIVIFCLFVSVCWHSDENKKNIEPS